MRSAQESGADAWIFEAAPYSAMGRGYALLTARTTTEELDAVIASGLRGVVLRSVRNGADVERVGARLAVHEARAGLPDSTMRIVVFAAADPESLFELGSFREASSRLDALIFDPEPLARRLDTRFRVDRLTAGPLRTARDLLLFAARAANVAAIDAGFPDLPDLDGLRAEAAIAYADGFDGKLALTSEQVGVIRAIFS